MHFRRFRCFPGMSIVQDSRSCHVQYSTVRELKSGVFVLTSVLPGGPTLCRTIG